MGHANIHGFGKRRHWLGSFAADSSQIRTCLSRFFCCVCSAAHQSVQATRQPRKARRQNDRAANAELCSRASHHTPEHAAAAHALQLQSLDVLRAVGERERISANQVLVQKGKDERDRHYVWQGLCRRTKEFQHPHDKDIWNGNRTLWGVQSLCAFNQRNRSYKNSS